MSEQQIADGARPRARVGDVIEHRPGQLIPANVTRMLGKDEMGRALDFCLIVEVGNGDVSWWSVGGDEHWTDEEIPDYAYPLAVTKVRDRRDSGSAEVAAIYQARHAEAVAYLGSGTQVAR